MVEMMVGRGNVLIDKDGINWLDFQSGILNTPLGHGSSTVASALREVADNGLINSYDRQPRVTGELIELMRTYQPGFIWKPFNTGGEAIDKAVQVATTILQDRTKPCRIAVLPGSFHGKLISMSWASIGDKAPWGNPLDLVVIDPTDAPQMIPQFDVLIYEPVQGHGGKVADQSWLRILCDERDAILIADEMITGFLRCGKRFMSADYADIIVTGKGISGGAPLSMVGMRDGIHADLPQGTIPVGWRSTGVGNNLCATIGLHVLEDLIANESDYLNTIGHVESDLLRMGFSSTGALGFKKLKDFSRTREIFEEGNFIASWHNPPFMRVGPSFVTTQSEMRGLGQALNEAGEL